MKKIKILTLFPEYFDSFKNTSIIKRAIQKESVKVECINFRDYTIDKHNNVDDTSFGGGAGMLLACQPIVDCIKENKTDKSYIVMMSPQGSVFNQRKARELAQKEELMILCGHYEGFDERIRDYVDEEISIGDYVLTGGEVGAIVVSDAVIRLNEGVIKKESHEDDSFENGLLEYPQYTKPVNFDGKKVPDVLLSGHHENIRKWRLKESLRKTYKRRPDLLKNRDFTLEEEKFLKEIIIEEKHLQK